MELWGPLHQQRSIHKALLSLCLVSILQHIFKKGSKNCTATMTWQ